MNDTPNALTVDDLYQLLGQARELGHGKQRVLIPYDPGQATLGGQPAMAIKGLRAGFDWDHGRYFITPEQRLGLPDATLRQRLREIERVAGRMHLALLGGAGNAAPTDSQRLENLRGLIEQLHAAVARGEQGSEPDPAG